MKTERILWQVVLVVFISACQFTDVVPLFSEATPTPLPTSTSSDNPIIEGGQGAPLLPPMQSIQNFPPEVDFSIEGAGNIIAPDGILEQISFSAVGGPDGEELCKYPSDRPYIDPTGYPKDTEIGFSVSFFTCGWADPTLPVKSIIYPDGTAVILPPDEYGGNDSIIFLSKYDDPVGLYILRISDGATTLEANIFFRERTLAGVEYVSSNKILLHHFKPYENIRFLAYAEVAEDRFSLAGEEVYGVDESGRLVINLPDDLYKYVLIDSNGAELLSTALYSYAQSDEATAEQKTMDFYNQIYEYPLCLSSENIRVFSRDTNIVLSNPAGGSLYTNPRINANNIAVFPAGTVLKIASETPYCSEGLMWRKVHIKDETGGTLYFGYVIEAEANGQSYLDIQEDNQLSCGTLASRLSVGITARVAFSDGSNMRIRGGPGFSQDIFNKVPEGTLLKIVDGPECVDDNNWWKIRTDNGLEGWMTETQDDVYLLEPY